MRDWMDCPEAAGPQSETENFDVAEFATPGWRIGGPPSRDAYPARDPAAEAIARTIEAERQADLGKVAPPDALDLTVPVTPAPAQRRPHRRTRPLEPDAEPAATPPSPSPAAPPRRPHELR